jgi:hypothetical protein
MNKNIVLMILIGVLLFFLIYNILSGDVFNGITNLIILGIVSSALLKGLKGQAKTERR